MAINSLGYNTQRISGLFSGMDTQSLVESMLAADQAKVDNVFRQQEKAQWKLDAYAELNSTVSNLRDTYLSVLGDKSLIKNAAYNNYNVTMSENSSIRITGTASAMPTNFQVLSATRATSARAVNQLAPDRFEANGPAKITGSAANLSADATIGSLKEQFGLKDGESLSFSINGDTFTFTQDQKLSDVMTAVNDSAKANVTMSLDANGAMTIQSDASGAASKLEFSNITGTAFAAGDKGFGIMQGSYEQGVGVRRSDTLAEVAWKMGAEIGDTFEFSVNGVDFSFDAATTTITDVMNKVNNDPNAKAMFSYSEMTEAFEIRSAETGESAQLEISGMEELFGLGGENGAKVEGGKDATLEVQVGDITRTIEQASNIFTLDGLEFEILNDYDKADPINVNVERDYQPTIDAVKSFVEDYNKMVEALNTKYYEQSYRSYQPLTEDERAAITEDEAKKWDEKAMSGVLRNDSAIGNLLTNLRQSLAVKVGDTGMSAFDIGLSTVAWSSDSWRTEQGKLQLDEEKLLAALKEDPNAVQKVLSGISEDGEVTTTGATSESGLLVRMNEYMRTFNTTMRTQNIQNTTKEIANYAEKMTDMLTKMSEKEERYWAQYSSMETMLAEMQSQQSWLASMLGTGTN